MRDRLKLFGMLLLFWWLYFIAARAIFLLYHIAATRTLSPIEIANTFVYGARLDLASTAYLVFLPALFLAASSFATLIGPTRFFIRAFTGTILVLVSLLLAVDLEIYQQWGRRVDGGILPYFATPKEMWASAGASPKLLLIAIALGLAGLGWWCFLRTANRILSRLEPAKPIAVLPLAFLAAVLFIPARGGVQEIPINQSSAYFSIHPFANHAAVNAAWNFFDSIYRGLADQTNPFVAEPVEEARRTVAARRSESETTAVPDLLREPRPNLIVILWESGTARAVEALGGVSGVTPQFDRLRHDGILFTQFYAAGDRTDKGVAAALSGFPALGRGSILTDPAKTAKLPMLSRQLQEAGYHSAFYYGGELEFANLKAYLRNAGFERVVGKKAFPRSSWTSKWGAHDGAVGERFLRDLGQLPTPFFATWLTLSSHEPFEVPDSLRVPGDRWQDHFFNSVAYTDAVLGRFIERARKQPWWEHTVIVILADHGRRVVPLDQAAPYKDAQAVYRIPMLWLGGALRARDTTVAAVASQTDLAPTLLALLGLPGGDRFPWGSNLFSGGDRFAYYGFEGGFGLVTPRGSYVYETAAGRPTSSAGAVVPDDLRLGRALLQLTYQDYLDR